MAKILVIDDETQLRDSLIELLELNNLEVITASNGQSGVELAMRSQPNLILCDTVMPDMTGYDVLTQLRNHDSTTLIPVILLTATSDYQALRRGMDLGAEDCLVKPIEPDDLIQAIQTQLRKRQAMVRRIQSLADLPVVNPENYLTIQSQHQDSLTGLFNIPGLEQQFNQCLGHGSLSKTSWSLTLLKIENYVDLQESLGHVFGAMVIKSVSRKLQTWVRTAQHPKITLAYLGAARFGILITAHAPKAATPPLEVALRQLLETPMSINNHMVALTIRFGHTTPFGNKPQTFNQYLLQATHDLEQADRSVSKNSYRPYLEKAIEARIKQALDQDQFEIYYQPQINLQSGQIIGAEALLRWASPDGKLISAGQFLPAIAESDLIFAIGEWVLKAVCTQHKLWHRQSKLAITTAINLSEKQFRSPRFQSRLVELLEEEGINPALIDLELTESLIAKDIQSTRQVLESLKEIGFSIAIDDFGTGYSSLGYLQQLPINILKIDKCFVRDLNNNFGNLVIVKAIIEMAHGLGIETIAEGVETAEELAALKQVGCDAMQGYLFSPALTAKEFEQLVFKDRTRCRQTVHNHAQVS